MSTPEHSPALEHEVTYCAVHPERETGLQCNKCGRYMCVQCAVQSPVGYRCRQCVRGIEDKFFNAQPADPAIVFAVCLVLSAIAGYLVAQVGFLLFILILAAPVGGFIAEVALRLIGRRRGRRTSAVAAAATALGALAPLIFVFAVTGRIVPDIGTLLFAGIATAAVYGRFKMRI